MITLLIKEAILSQLSDVGDLSMVAIMLSVDNSVPTCVASFLLSCSCTGHANIVYSPSSSSSPHNRQLLLGPCPLLARYTPKHPWPLRPCIRRYSMEPCSRSIHSLILGMSLCVHLWSFDESHFFCHLLKRVSLASPYDIPLFFGQVSFSPPVLILFDPYFFPVKS